MSRPETPELAKGDVLIATSGHHRNRMSVAEVRVVGFGPKWIHVIASDGYEAFLADPAQHRWRVRKFLREDMGEGERGKRVGYGSRLATLPQAAYDVETAEAWRFIRDRAGLTIERGSPYVDRDMMVGLAGILRELPPEAADDA